MLAWNSLETLSRDICHAIRQLRRSPSFTVIAVITLAMGIGANTAIFSLIYSLTLRSLRVRDPGQLVELLHRYPGEPALNGFSWDAYQLMRDHNHVFSDFVAAAYQPFHVRGANGEPEALAGGYVDGTFFPALGVRPAIGRLLAREDDRVGQPAVVAVLSWSYWKTRFNLDPAILGKQLIVEDVPVTIVGVAARKFSGMRVEATEAFWLPLAMDSILNRSGFGRRSLWLVGRLKPGVRIQQAQAEMAVLYQSTLDEQAKATNNPFIRKMKLEAEPAGAGISYLREEWTKPLWLVMAIVGILLLIACTNLASMLLARGAAREREMAVCVSLGASRLHLACEVLTESMMLSAAGSLFGVLLAYFGAGALARIMIAERRPGPSLEFLVRIDSRVLLFTVAVTVLTAALFGLAPALRAMRTAPVSSLRQAGSRGDTRRTRLLGRGLLVVQVALSVVLLSAAALFLGYLSTLRHINLGFQRDHVLLVTLDASGSGYDAEHLSHAYQQLLTRLAAIPGVRSATICTPSPISGAGANRGVQVQGYDPAPGEIRNVMETWVAPNYFQTLGIPLLAGRDFISQDQSGPKVAIVNQAMAHYYFGARSPIGMHVTFDGDDRPYQIVGVVGNTKYLEIREATYRAIYLDTFQDPPVASQFALRTGIDPDAVAPEVRRTVLALLKTVPVKEVTTLSDQVEASIVLERLLARLSGLFGVLGAMLSGIGLYGLLAYTVARRIHEIGIRMALGATRGDVIRMVLGDAAVMVGGGLAIGLPVAFWGESLAGSLVHDLPAASSIPIAFAGIAMIAAAMLAAYLPARRAASVEPMAALRYD